MNTSDKDFIVGFVRKCQETGLTDSQIKQAYAEVAVASYFGDEDFQRGFNKVIEKNANIMDTLSPYLDKVQPYLDKAKDFYGDNKGWIDPTLTGAGIGAVGGAGVAGKGNRLLGAILGALGGGGIGYGGRKTYDFLMDDPRSPIQDTRGSVDATDIGGAYRNFGVSPSQKLKTLKTPVVDKDIDLSNIGAGDSPVLINQ